VAKLRRVLIAYSWSVSPGDVYSGWADGRHDPSVGYCQGMNMLAATLLLTYTEEGKSLWRPPDLC
jgi:hypothetical protein